MLGRHIRNELISPTVKTSSIESGQKSSAEGFSNYKAKDKKSDNHEPVKQIEHEPNGDNETLSANDLEMKRLESHIV